MLAATLKALRRYEQDYVSLPHFADAIYDTTRVRISDRTLRRILRGETTPYTTVCAALTDFVAAREASQSAVGSR